MLGKTSDISQLCKQEWFKWDMFQDETAPFPDDVLRLGHYFGPSIHVCPATTIKILTDNWTSAPQVNLLNIDSR